jgi:hypothetical protein
MSREAQHHDGISCRGHQIIALLVHLPVLSMIEPEFLEPVIEMLERLEATALHSDQHVL